MSEQSDVFDFQEQQIPELSVSAVTVAYWNTLVAGQSVLESEDGTILEIFPDGTRREVKRIPPGVKVVAGSKLRLR